MAIYNNGLNPALPKPKATSSSSRSSSGNLSFADGSQINSSNEIVRNGKTYSGKGSPSKEYYNEIGGTDPNYTQTVTPPPTNPNIAVAEIAPTQALQLPQMSTDTAGADGMAGMASSALTGIDKYMKELTPPVTEASKKESALQKSLDTLLESSKGQTETLIKEENRLGLPQLQASLADINSQILTKSAAYDTQYNKQENELAPMSSIIGKQAAVRKMEASEIGFLTARALGMQGQIEAAKETAQRAVELKYGPILEEIDIKTKQLQILQPILTKEESRFAKALELKLADDKEAKLEEKEKAKVNLSYALEQGVNTRFGNKNGEFFDVNTGQGFKSPEDFFKAAGVKSFTEAYQRNLVTDVSMDKVAARGMVAKMATEYPDAGIQPYDSIETAQSKLQGSAKYAKDTELNQKSTGIYIPGVGDVSNTQLDNIRPYVTDFKNSEQVKNYRNVKEQLSFVKSLGQTPTDDQARIYAFAKVMDPTSAVKEGEYETVQQYSTALLERFGLKGKRIFDNGGILTNEARNFLGSTIEKRALSLESSYSNDLNEISRTIEMVGGLPEGSGRSFLNNAGLVNEPESQNPGNISFAGPDGKNWYFDSKEQANAAWKDAYGFEGPFKSAGNASVSTGIVKTLVSKYPQGTRGGQCTTFLHNLVDFPPIGDGKNQKFASVDKFGIKKANWAPRVGDVVVSGDNPTYGHTFLVNRILPGGKVQVTESNYSGNEKVTHTRVVSINDPKIYGAIRKPLKVRLA